MNSETPNPDHLVMLMRYSAWANQVLYQTLTGIDEQVLKQPRPGRTAGLAGVLGHIVAVASIWKGHLTAQPHGLKTRSLDPLPDLAQLRALQSELDTWYIEHALALHGSQRHHKITFRFVDGGSGTMSAEEMILHVANHGTYHRGYVADMLYESGLKPPTMDLPVFIRDVGY